jgi:DNA-binding SARP family transcriptional activator
MCESVRRLRSLIVPNRPARRYRREREMARTCLVRLLGDFEVVIDGRAVPASAWRRRRPAELVRFLALASGHRQHRELLIDTFWPDLESEAAAANLRKAVHYARRALGGERTIAHANDGLVLWPDGEVIVDASQVEAAGARALASGAGVEAALELFRGEPLPDDRYAEWAQPHRERIAALRLDLLRRAGRWQDVLELDGSDEQACRAVMQKHLDASQRQAAIRQFQRLRDVMRVDLGVSPELATVALFEQAVAGAAAQTATPQERAQALLARGLVDWNRRELDAAERAAADVRRLATENRLGRELGEASALLGMVAFARGRWLESFEEELAEAVRQPVGEATFILDAQLCLAEASLASADAVAVAQLAHKLLPLAIAQGSLPGEALMSLLIGESERFGGRLDESQEWLSRAAGLYERLGGDSGRSLALLRLAEVAVAGGRSGEAARPLALAHELAERSELSSHLLVQVFAAQLAVAGSPEGRRRILGEADASLQSRQVCAPCSIGFRVAAAITCARGSQLERARQCLADAERVAGMWQSGPWQAAVWEAKAELRLAEGEPAQAAALLREAARLFADSGRPLDEVRCATAAQATS